MFCFLSIKFQALHFIMNIHGLKKLTWHRLSFTITAFCTFSSERELINPKSAVFTPSEGQGYA